MENHPQYSAGLSDPRVEGRSDHLLEEILLAGPAHRILETLAERRLPPHGRRPVRGEPRPCPAAAEPSPPSRRGADSADDTVQALQWSDIPTRQDRALPARRSRQWRSPPDRSPNRPYACFHACAAPTTPAPCAVHPSQPDTPLSSPAEYRRSVRLPHRNESNRTHTISESPQNEAFPRFLR
jgi:hypothetical protein